MSGLFYNITREVQKSGSWSKCRVTICRLESNIPDLACQIYFDNFFSSLNLFEAITSNNCKGTGDIRENRLGKDCPLIQSEVLKKKDHLTTYLQ